MPYTVSVETDWGAWRSAEARKQVKSRGLTGNAETQGQLCLVQG